MDAPCCAGVAPLRAARARARISFTQALLLGLIALGLVSGTAQAAGRLPLGPAPRDVDGRFLNRAGPIPRAGPRVTLPFFLRRALGTLRARMGAPDLVENDGDFLRENAGHSAPTVTWVGHATLLVQLGHLTFLTDPTWSQTASPLPVGPRRFVKPGIALDALPPIDFVLISHNHYDHLDRDTLREIARRNPSVRMFVPLGNGELVRSAGVSHVTELDWGQSVSQGSLTVHCVPSQHWSRRGLRDERRALWASYVVTSENRRFYFAGDTGYSPDFESVGEALGPFDLAALPIGAYRPVKMMQPWHLNPEEAVQAGRDLGARNLLAVHFGTFDLSDEPLDEPPRRFRAAARSAGFEEERVWVFRVGETRSF